MKTKNKKILFLVLLWIFVAAPFIVLSVSAPEMVNKVMGAFKAVGGAIVIIGWIIAGILWLTAAGSPEKTGLAKKATTAAIIGTVLIVLATVAEETIRALLDTPLPPEPPEP